MHQFIQDVENMIKSYNKSYNEKHGKSKSLSIAKGLHFPDDAVTQKCAFIGRSGSGKTYAAGKLAEEFLLIGVQLIILDPVGVWNGLRTSADGKGKGFSIPVFGGEHGDIDLLPSSGALMASLIVEKGISAVLDVSYMRKNERKQFVTDFAEHLFFLKKKSRSAMHLIIEEAQVFVPQRVIKGEERMLGAMEDLVKLGRNYGIGISIISQRPQSVHKDCLNQTEALFAFQINGPHERKAIEDWVIDKGLSKSTVGKDLSGLEIGSCFLWSPQWLKMLEKIKILPKKTFDASETPKLNSAVNKSRTLAPVDLDKIAKEMESVIKEKKENDPTELKKQIAELKRELNKKPGQNIVKEDKSVHLKQDLILANKIIKEREIVIGKLTNSIHKIAAEVGVVSEIKLQAIKSRIAIQESQVKEKKPIESPAMAATRFGNMVSVSTNQNISKCENAILIALAQRAKKSTKTQIAILSGYSSKSGGFNNSLSKLRTCEYIQGGSGNLEITEKGLEVLGEYQELPTGGALHNYWYSKLSKSEATILKALVDSYPDELGKEFIAKMTNYSASSGGFNNSLSKLRTLELIEGFKHMKASDSLFE